MGGPFKCWNKPFHAKKGVNCCEFCNYCISHQVLNSQMKSFSSMVPTTFKNQQGPLEVPYMSSMSHTSGIDITSGIFALEFEESP